MKCRRWVGVAAASDVTASLGSRGSEGMTGIGVAFVGVMVAFDAE
jgi:hypothetical protein